MAGIYHNATLGVISLSSDGENWITIADKNLGATQVRNSGDALSEANCGKYYQWGNNYGFPSSGFTISGTQVNAGTYGPGNYYSSNTFISNTYSWDTSSNENLWGRISGTKAAMQGPCPDGYHVPTQSEFASLMTYMFDNNTLSASVIKIPFGGYINTGGSLTQRGVWASYRTSQSNRNGTRIAPYGYDIMYYNRPKYRDYYSWVSERPVQGRSIRPFKNEAVIPYANEGWSKLYGDDLPDRPIPPLPKLKWLVKGNNYYYFDEAPVHVSGISLDKDSIILTTVGQTEQLTATVTPEDAVNKKVIWTSSDTSVATVSSTGLVTCVTPGDATITCTAVDGGASASCSVIARKNVYADFLLVGGGGGGGGNQYENLPGGGGGGGGFIECNNYLINQGSYNIVIGAGGTRGSKTTSGACGGNSSFNGLIAYGGGGGGVGGQGVGCNGASGGGGGGGSARVLGGQGTQGCCGGCGNSGMGGGGGGAGANGCNGNGSGPGGNGGNGKCSCISGTCVWYSGGGGGGGYTTYAHGTGGCGGGTLDATCYGGGGGGGQYCCSNNQYGYAGYKGVFILRYPTACGYDITGGTCYTCGDYTIHCFTSAGTLTVS